MNIVMQDTVETTRDSLADAAVHPVGPGSAVIEPFRRGEYSAGKLLMVSCHYRLFKDVAYEVPDDLGAELVGIGAAAEA